MTDSEEEIARLRTQLAEAENEAIQQQQGALLWIAAMVAKLGGASKTVTLTKREMLDAFEMELERADGADGSTTLRIGQALAVVHHRPKVIAGGGGAVVALDLASPPMG